MRTTRKKTSNKTAAWLTIATALVLIMCCSTCLWAASNPETDEPSVVPGIQPEQVVTTTSSEATPPPPVETLPTNNGGGDPNPDPNPDPNDGGDSDRHVGTARAGAFCSPAGAVGYTSSGTLLRCGPARDGRNRWQR